MQQWPASFEPQSIAATLQSGCVSYKDVMQYCSNAHERRSCSGRSNNSSIKKVNLWILSDVMEWSQSHGNANETYIRTTTGITCPRCLTILSHSSEWLFCDYLRPTGNRLLLGCGMSGHWVQFCYENALDTQKFRGIASVFMGKLHVAPYGVMRFPIRSGMTITYSAQ